MAYDMAEGVFLSSSYGSPQRRRRAYILAVRRVKGAKSYEAKKAMQMTLDWNAEKPRFTDFVLPGASAYLAQELQRHQTRQDIFRANSGLDLRNDFKAQTQRNNMFPII